ncbi:hypothetical protein WM11_06935 [Burkholderia ubonensis]|nr:hypothetical protein WM10_05350 [Burkholderia ubonensis]KWK09304.1 hypothetical protein WM11_06935 [Burkholderia ubonensis]KWK18390.1 hypothetical protein WM12_02415 [Burkholderia ubonensis]KWK33892.1 hypothetical protein WM13_29325 [Burkholderia ubonensis]KWK40718.1 hypothetical protein WM14_18280 [Burkholderia ubonensis]
MDVRWFGAGLLRGMSDVIGVMRERFPFVKFAGGECRALDGGTAIGGRGDRRMGAQRSALGGEPVEAQREHRDERDHEGGQQSGMSRKIHEGS